jgi:GTP-binding protein
MLPLVALVGRPNVGKSTLFNALTRSRDALVHDQPGVTRDRNYGICRLDEENPFMVVDTGGIAGEEEGLAGATARQARAAAEEADLVLFIVDGREGASTLDDDILTWLRKTSRPTLLVINKIDGLEESTAISEFSRYGFNDVITVSAAHRRASTNCWRKCTPGCRRKAPPKCWTTTRRACASPSLAVPTSANPPCSIACWAKSA